MFRDAPHIALSPDADRVQNPGEGLASIKGGPSMRTLPAAGNEPVETPLARLRAVAEYARRVFEDESLAATWLSRAHRAVRGGLCAVGAACQTVEGFREAMAELSRIERLDRREALELARVRPWLMAAAETSRSTTSR
jgi:hypothetical protein